MINSDEQLLTLTCTAQVAAAEQQLDSLMTSLQKELADIYIEFSQQRIFGVFLITNAKEVCVGAGRCVGGVGCILLSLSLLLSLSQ